VTLPAQPPTSAADAETIPPPDSDPANASGQAAAASRNGERPEALASWPEIAGYQILAELGRGGMGVVYKAQDSRLQRVVALKMILSGAHAGPADVARFLSEAEAVAALQHPNIVQVFECGRHQDLPFMALEFVPGGSLADRLRKGPLPAKVAAQLVEQLARGMNVAHQAGIVHRDLKPGNVLLTDNHTPKITDFGLAKRVEGGAGPTVTGSILGTPSYMAPEQAQGEGKRVGPAADVYALGAIVYECLTGRPPFQAASPLDTLLQVLREEPIPPARLNPKIPRDLGTICLKCLHKQPLKRYASAEALAEDLRRFQAGEPIRARPVGRAERALKWVRRKPAAAALLAVSVLAVVTLFALSWFFIAELQDRTQIAEDAAADARLKKKETEAALQKAEDAAADAKLKKEAADAALQKAEQTWIASLLSRIGHKEGPLDQIELDALAELASQASDPVRLALLAKALEQEATAVKIERRAELVALALVGLDLQKKQQALQLLGTRFHAKGTTAKVREACAFLSLALGSPDQAQAAVMAQALISRMAKTYDPGTLKPMAEGLAAVAVKLEPKEAHEVAQLLTAQMNTGAPYVREALAYGLAAAAAKLEPKEAAQLLTSQMAHQIKGYPHLLKPLAERLTAVAAQLDTKQAHQLAKLLSAQMAMTNSPKALKALAEALSAAAAKLEPKEAAQLLSAQMAKTYDPFALKALAEGLAAVAPKLEPKAAHEVAQLLTAQMTKTEQPLYLPALAEALTAVAARLEPKVAQQQAAEAAQLLIAQLAQTKNPDALKALAEGLATLAARLEPKVAHEAAQLLSARMADTNDPVTLKALGKGLVAVAAQLEPKEAQQLAAEATQLLTAQLPKTKDNPYAQKVVAEALTTVAARLEPKEAAQLLIAQMANTNDSVARKPLAEGLTALAAQLEPNEVAQLLTAQMAKTDHPYTLKILAEGLTAVAAKLEPKEAQQFAAGAAQLLTAQMAKPNNPYAQKALAEGLMAVAVKLEPKMAQQRAAEAVQLLTAQMAKPSGPDALKALAEGLTAVTAQLEPKEAAQLLSAQMKNPNHVYILKTLAEGLAAVAAKLEAKEAHQAVAEPAQLLSAQMIKYKDNPFFLKALAEGLTAVAGKLEPKAAQEVAAETVQLLSAQMAKSTDHSARKALVEGLLALAPKLEPKEAQQRAAEAAQLLTAQMAKANYPNVLEPWAEMLTAVTTQLDQPGLVNLLKNPICVGPARQVVLQELGQRAGRSFATVWEFVAWAEQHAPGLDLRSPWQPAKDLGTP
jgi:hypothetical protein